MAKIKVVLDADVIIHFTQGGLLYKLPSFMPDYEFVVLDIVYNEVLYPFQRLVLEGEIKKNKIHLLEHEIKGKAMKVYMQLTNVMRRGKGESACIAYCETHEDVLGSSNLKDITDYCDSKGIKYYTTIDLLKEGIKQGRINVEDAENFVQTVKAAGGKLPDDIDFNS